MDALHLETNDPVIVALQNALRSKNKKVKELEVSCHMRDDTSWRGSNQWNPKANLFGVTI